MPQRAAACSIILCTYLGYISKSPSRSPFRVMRLTLPALYAPGVQEEPSERKER
jgi:hypothetical protein